MPPAGKESLFIEFDRSQLTFTTDVDEVREFVATTFQHMLVPSVSSSAGEVHLRRVHGGYELAGRETVFLGGTPVQPVLHFVKDEVRLCFMRSRADLLWLHAGAVEQDGYALLLSGSSGQGKSTLSKLLSGRGWRYMSDDIVPVRPENDSAIPFPQAPTHRLHPGREVTTDEVATLQRETAVLHPDVVARGESHIRAIAFITYDGTSPTDIARLSQGHSAFALLSNLTNFLDHKSAAVEAAVRLARKVPMFSVRYSEPEAGADELSGLWSAL